MALFHPIQKICVTSAKSSDQKILLAASGPMLSAINLETGKICSQWPTHEEDENGELADSHDDDRPLKRRKTHNGSPHPFSRRHSDDSEVSVEIVAERKKGERRRPKVSNHKLPNISHLIVTKDGQHVIVVTTDDKTVTVFDLNPVGQLQVLSQRALPKKICAIKLTSDEKTILTADKFGDVYAIPLEPSENWTSKKRQSDIQSSFTPSATERTVHTKGNLEALRQQQQQKHVKQRKESPEFEHKLLLGHVSLLTDLAVAEGVVGGRQRPYILTSDRDEHIRVSRGIPQTHIIETYCMGHHEFVSKLVVVPWAPSLLIAGNGEPSLKLFHWQTGTMLQELSLTNLQRSYSNIFRAPDERSLAKTAVSGIWPLRLGGQSSDAISPGLILVALEGIPVLLTFHLDEHQRLQHRDCYPLARNILDISQIDQDSEILVSFDFIHKPYSVKHIQDGVSHGCSLQGLRAVFTNPKTTQDSQTWGVRWETTNQARVQHSKHLFRLGSTTNNSVSKNKDQEKLYSPIGEFLYGLENLRKKTGSVAEDDSLDIGEVPADVALQ